MVVVLAVIVISIRDGHRSCIPFLPRAMMRARCMSTIAGTRRMQPKSGSQGTQHRCPCHFIIFATFLAFDFSSVYCHAGVSRVYDASRLGFGAPDREPVLFTSTDISAGIERAENILPETPAL